jgi:hypothetical protein
VHHLCEVLDRLIEHGHVLRADALVDLDADFLAAREAPELSSVLQRFVRGWSP